MSQSQLSKYLNFWLLQLGVISTNNKAHGPKCMENIFNFWNIIKFATLFSCYQVDNVIKYIQIGTSDIFDEKLINPKKIEYAVRDRMLSSELFSGLLVFYVNENESKRSTLVSKTVAFKENFETWHKNEILVGPKKMLLWKLHIMLHLMKQLLEVLPKDGDYLK